jgi:hypothetical protein
MDGLRISHLQRDTHAFIIPEKVGSCRRSEQDSAESIFDARSLRRITTDRYRNKNAVHQSTTFRTWPARAISAERSAI